MERSPKSAHLYPYIDDPTIIYKLDNSQQLKITRYWNI